MRRKGRIAVPIALLAAVATISLALVYSPASDNVATFSAQSFIVFGLFGAALVALVASFFTLNGKDDLKSLLLTSIGAAALVGGFLAMAFPNVVLPGVTMHEAVAPDSSAWLLAFVLVPAIPVTLAYNAVAYHLFRGKTGRHGDDDLHSSTQKG